MPGHSRYITVKERQKQKKKYTFLLLSCVLGLLFFIIFLPIIGEQVPASTMLKYLFPLAILLLIAILTLNILLWRSILKIYFYKTNKYNKK